MRINPRGIDKDEELLIINHSGGGLGSSLSFYASPAPDEQHTDGKVALETIKLLEANQDKPFFIAAGFYRPHCPYVAPKKYFDLYPLEKIPAPAFKPEDIDKVLPAARWLAKPHYGLEPLKLREAIQAYYASISFLDANVGRLLDGLDRLKLTDNTLIVFWSDHGYALGEHGQWMKQNLFEVVARNPLLIAGPGVKANQASPRTVEFVDLYPTLADVCGLTGAPANLAGRSLRPLLTNAKTKWDKPALTQVRRAGGANAANPFMGYSIRNERYRYTEWDEGRKGAELYDYDRDPQEQKNLANDAASAKTVEQMKRLLHQARGLH